MFANELSAQILVPSQLAIKKINKQIPSGNFFKKVDSLNATAIKIYRVEAVGLSMKDYAQKLQFCVKI